MGVTNDKEIDQTLMDKIFQLGQENREWAGKYNTLVIALEDIIHNEEVYDMQDVIRVAKEALKQV